MSKYNYLASMIDDIKEWITDNYTPEEIKDNLTTRRRWCEKLEDDLYCEDSITGNASGSYTFNRNTAKEYVTENLDLLHAAFFEFDTEKDQIAQLFLDEEWETMDVYIRCYLLYRAIPAAIAEIEEDIDE